jgi:ankyrin repeat protein
MGNADPDAQDSLKQTPMHKAVMTAGIEALQVLLQRSNASLGIADAAMCTPMMLAAEHGKHEHLALLLARDTTLVADANQDGWTALHLAAHGREMRKPPKKLSKFGTSVKLLLEAKAPLEAVAEGEKTPLHRAAMTGDPEVASLLLEAGADTGAADICRWTPLHYACHEGHLQICRVLLEARAAVQRENPACLTPLAVATMENHAKIAELLVKHGADPNLKGRGLASPMMIARKEPEKFSDILALFELGYVHHET